MGTDENFECLELAKALEKAFEIRFGQLIDANNPEGKSAPLYIAMITNPQFKLNYMGLKTIQPSVLHQLKEMLVSAAIDIEKSKLSTHSCESSNNIINTAAIEHGNSKYKLYVIHVFCIHR